MRLVHRALPHPVLSASLLVIWLILNATLNPGHVLLGAILGWGLPLLTRRYWPERPPFHRLPLLWRLFLIVNWDILRANLTVARLTLTRPVATLQPQFAVIPPISAVPTASRSCSASSRSRPARSRPIWTRSTGSYWCTGCTSRIPRARWR